MPHLRPARKTIPLEELIQRRKSEMKPARIEFFGKQDRLPQEYSSFYANSKGNVFGVKKVPVGNTIDLELFRIGQKDDSQVGTASLIPTRWERAVYIQGVFRFPHELSSSKGIVSTEGIQIFRAVVEEAIKEARKHKWHRVSLICGPDLVPFYRRFGFRRKLLSYPMMHPEMILDFSPEKPYSRLWRKLVGKL